MRRNGGTIGRERCRVEPPPSSKHRGETLKDRRELVYKGGKVRVRGVNTSGQGKSVRKDVVHVWCHYGHGTVGVWVM